MTAGQHLQRTAELLSGVSPPYSPSESPNHSSGSRSSSSSSLDRPPPASSAGGTFAATRDTHTHSTVRLEGEHNPHQRTGRHPRPAHNHTTTPLSFFGATNGDAQHHHSFAPVKTLRIELVETEITLAMGRPAMLEGTLYLSLQKSTKVKSLQLEFSGRSFISWADENTYSPAARHTTVPHIEHTWPLVEHQHKQPPTIMPAGVHAYPFSLELPDTLPESLSMAHGKVIYRLTATLTKPGLTFHSSNAIATVNILRRHRAQPLASRTHQRGGRLVNSAQDKIKYMVTLPHLRILHSTKLPLQVSITALTHHTSIQVLQVGLWERAVYRTEDRQRVDMRLVKIQKSEGWSHEDHSQSLDQSVRTWNKVLLFDMPCIGTAIHQCNPSADNGLIKVTHILRFTVLGSDGSKRFRVENEICLAVLALEDEHHHASTGGGEEDEVEYDENGNPVTELPSYLTSFTTPRLSIDSEPELDPTDDDLLLALVAARIHLPSYAESEDGSNSRGPSRDVSRNVSQATSRNASPERTPAGTSSQSHRTSLCQDFDAGVIAAASSTSPLVPHGRTSIHDPQVRFSMGSVYPVHHPSPLQSS
ncbi:hypothetical protein BGZ70_000682 [Mortierella alpina]|uniref:Arrestin-like N-terminal domain-containing protein n=1 Tax=Mortierella alpina TaxID=64518 RepID=A0A9P6JBZ8_MORAP|nr:hypothetical protein BGZ70_000682 [Mortierella alpina]